MKNLNEFYEALRHLSREENDVQKAWQNWNGVEWESEFIWHELKEGDCIIFPDWSIAFVENGQGKIFVNQNGGWVLYEHMVLGLTDVQDMIVDKMNELKSQGYSSDDC
ncbi:MAG: hypothetical protein PHN68_12085 [Prolixibacteraceae bacterium]|nr:hypothetical protein [Prolixibacteraceae bacterium]